MEAWKAIIQGCPAMPNIRTLIQGPGYQHVLLSSAIPAEVRASLAHSICTVLNENPTNPKSIATK